MLTELLNTLYGRNTKLVYTGFLISALRPNIQQMRWRQVFYPSGNATAGKNITVSVFLQQMRKNQDCFK